MKIKFVVTVEGEPDIEKIQEAYSITEGLDDTETMRIYLQMVLNSEMDYDHTGTEVVVEGKDNVAWY